MKLVFVRQPEFVVTVATVVDEHGGVTLRLRTTEPAAVRPKRRQPKPPAVPKTVDQLSFRELRQLSVMTGIGAQVVSDLYSWPPHKHRGVKPSTAPFSLTSAARRVGAADTTACRQAACCCPDTGGDGGGKLHRWPCTYMDVAAGTATSYAQSMAHDEAVSPNPDPNPDLSPNPNDTVSLAAPSSPPLSTPHPPGRCGFAHADALIAPPPCPAVRWRSGTPPSVPRPKASWRLRASRDGPSRTIPAARVGPGRPTRCRLPTSRHAGYTTRASSAATRASTAGTAAQAAAQAAAWTALLPRWRRARRLSHPCSPRLRRSSCRRAPRRVGSRRSRRGSFRRRAPRRQTAASCCRTSCTITTYCARGSGEGRKYKVATY